MYMSELKTFDSQRIYWACEQVELVAGDIDDLHLDDNSFYIKSEADEVIAELKNQIHEYAQGLYEIQSRAENEIRHGKYKRCLAMAEMCMFKSRISYFEKKSNKSRRMSKWCQRWHELAKQFTTNNSTAQ